MQKTEGLMKRPIVYLRPIKILPRPMEGIAIKYNQSWIWLQCVHIHHPYIY